MSAISLPFLGGIGLPELIIIVVIMLIMFGPSLLAAAIGVGVVVSQRRLKPAGPNSVADTCPRDEGAAMSESLDRQAIIDEEHLRLLPVCYWVMGALTVFLALYGLIYVGMGLLFAFAPGFGSSEDASLAFVAWIFIAIGLGFTVVGGTIATLQILAGFWIRKRRHRVVCLVVAGISCMFIPFGTLIGVFTFLTLMRPTVTALFDTTRDSESRGESEAENRPDPSAAPAE